MLNISFFGAFFYEIFTGYLLQKSLEISFFEIGSVQNFFEPYTRIKNDK